MCCVVLLSILWELLKDIIVLNNSPYVEDNCSSLGATYNETIYKSKSNTSQKQLYVYI